MEFVVDQSLARQIDVIVRDYHLRHKDMPDVRLLVNTNTRDAYLDPYLCLHDASMICHRYANVKVVSTPDIADAVALLQFGDEPFIELQGVLT